MSFEKLCNSKQLDLRMHATRGHHVVVEAALQLRSVDVEGTPHIRGEIHGRERGGRLQECANVVVVHERRRCDLLGKIACDLHRVWKIGVMSDMDPSLTDD